MFAVRVVAITITVSGPSAMKEKVSKISFIDRLNVLRIDTLF